MALPDAIIDLQDNRLGSVPADNSGAHVKIGVSSAGVANTLYTIARVDDVKTKVVSGPGPESAAKAVRKGIRPVYFMPLGIATPGAAGAVTAVGTSTSVLTVAGAAKDSYSVIVTITRAGANLAANTAAFTVSLDGGDTTSPETGVPVSGIYTGLTTETGLTLTFGAGTFVIGTTYTFVCTAPQADTTTLAAALDAVLATPGLNIEGIQICAPLNAVAAAVLASKIDAARAQYRFWWGAGETRLPTAAESTDQWETAILADFANHFHRWSVIGAADAEVISELTARVDRRNPMSEMLNHALKGAISQSVGEVARGTVQGITKLYHDDFGREKLSKRFMTMRTFDGLGGFYATHGQTLAPVNSDFQKFENIRTINAVARAARLVGLKYVNSRFRVNGDGTLNTLDLEALISDFNTPMDKLVNAGDLSGYTVSIDPTQNILSTKQIAVYVDCIPVGIAETIRVFIGYLNPRLAVPPVAAPAVPA
jgi:hypothetical protein